MGAACGVSGTGEALRERGGGGGHDGDRTGLREPGLGGEGWIDGRRGEESRMSGGKWKKE